MKRINTIVFDLDGTLLNTLEDLANSVNFALGHNGYPLRSKIEIRHFLGNGIEILMRKSVPSNINEDQFRTTFSCFRNHYVAHCLDVTQPYNGIMRLLEELKRRKIKMAIVSNKLQPAVDELNQRFFQQYIDIAIGEGPMIRRKPNPDAVISALQKLDSCKDNSIYIGDSEVDIETSQNAQIECISCSWGFRDRDFLEALHPKYLIDKPTDLLKLLDSNEK